MEVHNVTTPDGFKLVIFRIPHGRNGPTNTTRPPVLVVHGILCSSTDWVIAGANSSLGKLLQLFGTEDRATLRRYKCKISDIRDLSTI